MITLILSYCSYHGDFMRLRVPVPVIILRFHFMSDNFNAVVRLQLFVEIQSYQILYTKVSAFTTISTTWFGN